MQQTTLLIGSVSGTAELAGLTLKDELVSHGHKLHIENKPDFKAFLKRQQELLLIITSTTGAGELPANIRPLWRKLFTRRPNLNGFSYAVSVLGERSYGDDFCLGGIKLDCLLTELGARKISEPLLVDTEENDQPEKMISQWGMNLSSQHCYSSAA